MFVIACLNDEITLHFGHKDVRIRHTCPERLRDNRPVRPADVGSGTCEGKSASLH